MARTLKKAAANIVFGNLERKQIPPGNELDKPVSASPLDSAAGDAIPPIGHETNRSRGKFSEQVAPKSEIGFETQHREDKPPGMKQTLKTRFRATKPMHTPHPSALEYQKKPRMEDSNMENKTYREFVTEAKRGRPRKLRPGEQADTEHIQDQLRKLTHPNHVDVHFKDGTKHKIPREHANRALLHLDTLKPIHRAEHAEHMGKGHAEFYHVLTHKSIPAKGPKITLAGPKLRKEDYDPKAAADYKSHKIGQKVFKQGAKEDPANASWHKQIADAEGKVAKKSLKKAVTGMGEEAEQLDELTGKKKFVQNVDKMYDKNDAANDEIASDNDNMRAKGHITGKEYKQLEKERSKDYHKTGNRIDSAVSKAKRLLGKGTQKEEAELDETKAIKGTHASKSHGAPSISPSKVGYAGKQPSLKGQRLKVREDYDHVKKAAKDDLEKVAKKFHKREDGLSPAGMTLDYSAHHLGNDAVTGTTEKGKKEFHAYKFFQNSKDRKRINKSLKPSTKKVVGEEYDDDGWHAHREMHGAKGISKEDYAPMEKGATQAHPDEKTKDAASRKQGAEKPKQLKLSKEEWALYDSLSDINKTIFEKMGREQLDRLMEAYRSKRNK